MGIKEQWHTGQIRISQGSSDFCEAVCKTPLDYNDNKDLLSIYVE